MSMQRFANKVALVTGGASGIGKACAVAFAREGARVTVVDLNVSSGHETVEEIRDSGGAALFLRADVSEPAAVERMVADSLMAFGRLDFAVHSAQIGVEPIATVDEWRRVIDVNLNGVFLSMRCEVTQMVKQGGGSIVNVVTIPNAAGFALASAHGAAYLGVLSLGQVAAREYAALGVRVHSIGPESMGTPMAADAAYSGSITSPNPVRCLITPEDVASLTTFLCSDEASTMTGGHYPLDERFNAR